jgi:hypothetical protein
MNLPDLHDLEIAGVHTLRGDTQTLAAAARPRSCVSHSTDLAGVDSKPRCCGAGEGPQAAAALRQQLGRARGFGGGRRLARQARLRHRAVEFRRLSKGHGIDWTTFEDILAEASDYWRERHKPFWVFVS